MCNDAVETAVHVFLHKHLQAPAEQQPAWREVAAVFVDNWCALVFKPWMKTEMEKHANV